ncbi:hypothetical protein E2C01_048977 [Portunus trituberculatus]|uniref:Uncharacterized protein n=1 Tax=Portunus trituberculatus TaxID=210409 RepID=A0A5B7GBY8_PORTR|nr:hypothetical protein [Portunus trituberculatus]
MNDSGRGGRGRGSTPRRLMAFSLRRYQIRCYWRETQSRRRTESRSRPEESRGRDVNGAESRPRL